MESDLSELCQKALGGNARISDLKRLTGGASATTWSFDYNGVPLVLRQKAPETEDNVDMPGLESSSLKTEAELITKAGEHGVKAPKIYAVTEADSALGESVLMSRVHGEALPQILFKDTKYDKALSGLTVECAATLAKIHDIPVDSLTSDLVTRTPLETLDLMKAQYKSFGQGSPVLASALSWMTENCPPPTPPVLVHGDFRMGNLLIDEAGLSSVLDWELTHIGDPVSDISFFCAPPWRFGRYAQGAGGIGSIDDLVKSYEAASGRKIDTSRLLWWRMQASVNWCLMCMIMGNLWRSGIDRELERIVIGTRVSESEIDVLLLFDEIYKFDDKFDLAYLSPPEIANKAETKPDELASALSEWLTDDIIPNMSGRESFKARVARNAIGMLQRSSRLSPDFSVTQNKRLAGLNLNETELSQHLLNGDLNLQSEKVRRHIKQTTLEQIAIDQPKYSGFKVALSNWSAS